MALTAPLAAHHRHTVNPSACGSILRDRSPDQGCLDPSKTKTLDPLTRARETEPPMTDLTTLDFFATLVSRARGQYVEIRALAPTRGKRNRQSWHSDAREAAEAALTYDRDGYDVYVGALPRKSKGVGGAAGIDSWPWVWADIDVGTEGHRVPSIHETEESALAAIEATGIAPTMVIRSGGGLHVWWALDDHTTPFNRDALRGLANSIGGDWSATDSARILRVPGTWNRKLGPERLRAVIAREITDVSHPVDAFLAFVAEAPAAANSPSIRPYDAANDVPIDEIVSWVSPEAQLGEPEAGSGRRRGVCPVHHGTNRQAFVVGGTQQGNRVKCFGDCNRSWGPVDYVAAVVGCSPSEAQRRIADRWGLPKVSDRPVSAPAAPRAGAIELPPYAESANGRKLADPMNAARAIVESGWTFAWNEMTSCVWGSQGGGALEPIESHHITHMRAEITRRIGLVASETLVRDGLVAVARQRCFHPIRDYLRGLTWDGVPRIDGAAAAYLHNDSPLASTMVRKWFIAAVARALDPGCKVDTTLILQGVQGTRKSTFFAELGGEWFSDTRVALHDKDCYMQIAKTWIYEFAEIDQQLRSTDSSIIKAIMSSSRDAYRPPFLRDVIEVRRSGVIVGTTNQKEFLADDTGSRRFWVVPVPSTVDWMAVRESRDQLWAEAVTLHAAGEAWHLTNDEDAEREELNEHFGSEVDALIEPIATYCEGKSVVRIIDVLTSLGIMHSQADRRIQRRVATALRSLGYERKQVRLEGRPTWCFVLTAE